MWLRLHHLPTNYHVITTPPPPHQLPRDYDSTTSRPTTTWSRLHHLPTNYHVITTPPPPDQLPRDYDSTTYRNQRKHQIWQWNVITCILYDYCQYWYIDGEKLLWVISGFWNWVTRRMPLVKQKRPEHLSSPSVLCRVRVARSAGFHVVFCRSFFVLLSFFFWPLYFLSFELLILIAYLVSSNSS
jgi:hypothetical protein